ncbi:hypothetical protein [Cellulosimicrobium cellulans]|uniref:hypothetical protein n=1 Tax=Cellulosimicrobium cellulans TaxID=1710 RepID=UPI0018DEE3D5|nr:hypothetical protein [Cellulosimicrobium cellulans]
MRGWVYIARQVYPEVVVPILVNVTQTYPVHGSRAEKLESVERSWPVRHVKFGADFDTSPAAAELLAHADLLLAVRKNVVVEARSITGHTVDPQDGRVRFVTRPMEGADALIGRRLAKPYAWVRGQGWPVQHVGLGEEITELTDLLEPEGDEIVHHTEIAGVYEISVTASGELLVVGPRGRDVTVRAEFEGGGDEFVEERDADGRFSVALTTDGDLVVANPAARPVTVRSR